MSSRSKVVGWWVAPLVALGACNALVGVEDVHLRDDTSGGTSTEGGAGNGGTNNGGTGNGGVPATAGSDTTEGGTGGVPGGAGEPALGGAGAGAAGEPSTGGAGGAGGEGGENWDDEPHPCPAPGEDKPVRGPLTLVQFAPLDATRGRLNVSADGKNAYVTTWGHITQHFTRDVATGMLTAKSTAGVYNGEYVALSPLSQRLFVGGTNGLQFYSIPIAADGSIANSNAIGPAGYVSAMDAVRVGSMIYLASQSSVRAIKNDTYDTTNYVPGTYNGVRGLNRSREYLYWTEYANQQQFPNGATAVGRARFQCDGSLGPRETFPTGYAPWDVAACDETGYVYVLHVAESAEKPGWVDVVDLSTCAGDFSTCKPKKKLTSDDIPGLFAPNGIRMSTDCSTLYLSNNVDQQGHFLVLSLKDPEAPRLLQTFEADQLYGGVEMTGTIHAWHMTFHDGYLYVPMEFGDGVAVFKGR